MTKKNDLTRIEDLSELLHSEDEEDFQSLDSGSTFDEKTEPNHNLSDDDLFDTNSDDDLGNLSQEKTDPDMNLAEMTESPEDNNEFGGDFSTDFNNDFNGEDSVESSDTFGDTSSTEFSF